jgi:hypothetical protein
VSAAPEARPDLLALGEIRVARADGTTMVLRRNGLLEERGELIGTLHADGRFVEIGGETRITMDPDGSIAFARGEGRITIAEDGTATAAYRGVSNEVARFDARGHVLGVRNPPRVEGLTPPLRRAAMFVVLFPDLLMATAPEVRR